MIYKLEKGLLPTLNEPTWSHTLKPTGLDLINVKEDERRSIRCHVYDT
jgi:hypothetical protein